MSAAHPLFGHGKVGALLFNHAHHAITNANKDATVQQGKNMTAKKCKCHQDSPFLWAKNQRPSMFASDIAFKPKKAQVYENLTQEENLIAYKQFSIHSRAHPNKKPELNKHEIS
jgi:hypothetical protein